ncbi:MAG: putative lipid II flippase FtsW [Candidatus Omnitrophica bacterium]|nr:putative lipid II flippase FtsW [Candidatus Omnitrophota bacterium]
MRISKDGEKVLIYVFILVALGIVMTYSASAMYAERFYQDSMYFLKKQLIFAAVGFVALIGCMAIPPAWIRANSRLLAVFAILFVLCVFLPVIGKSGGGARRWICFFDFSIQPVEFAKIAVCAYLSDYLTRKSKKISQGALGVFFPPLLIIGTLCLALILQPDLGSIVFIFLVAMLLFFLAGIKMRYVFATLAMGIPLLFLLIVSEPYRFKRLISYLNPWDDPRGSGFQIIQSFLAFGLGGWKGVGLGASTQKLFYLPQSYNDFIFSIIGEELGLVGAITVIGLFVCILMHGAAISSRLTDPFKKYFAYSLTLLITVQSIINILVTTGLIPTKGLPLPFVSYGGSSLVFNMAAIGLLIGLDVKRTR